MDSFEINKIVAAILMVALLIIGISKLSNVLFYVEKPKSPGYVVEVEQASVTSETTSVVEEEKIDIAALMALGDISSGEKIFKKCAACHSIIKGGKNFSSVKKSKLKKEKMSLILQDTINEVKTNTANAWSTYQSAQSVLKATESQVKAAEIANEGITLEYDSGNTRTTLEVIQSTSLLLDARIANAKSERDFVVPQFELAKRLGSLSIKSLN